MISQRYRRHIAALVSIVMGLMTVACAQEDEANSTLYSSASAKAAAAPPGCMKNRLKAIPAIWAIQAPLLGSSSKGQSGGLRIQIGAYGTPRSLSGPGFRLKNVSSTKDPLSAAVATLSAHKALLGLSTDDTLQGSTGVVQNATSSVVHLRLAEVEPFQCGRVADAGKSTAVDVRPTQVQYSQLLERA